MNQQKILQIVSFNEFNVYQNVSLIKITIQ